MPDKPYLPTLPSLLPYETKQLVFSRTVPPPTPEAAQLRLSVLRHFDRGLTYALKDREDANKRAELELLQKEIEFLKSWLDDHEHAGKHSPLPEVLFAGTQGDPVLFRLVVIRMLKAVKNKDGIQRSFKQEANRLIEKLGLRANEVANQHLFNLLSDAYRFYSDLSKSEHPLNMYEKYTLEGLREYKHAAAA